jgi:hypothetical protein
MDGFIPNMFLIFKATSIFLCWSYEWWHVGVMVLASLVTWILTTVWFNQPTYDGPEQVRYLTKVEFDRMVLGYVPL